MTWNVQLLHYADQRVPGAQVFYQSGWDSWQTFSFYVFLMTKDDMVVLIDCGMDNPDPMNQAIEQSLGEGGRIRHVATGGIIAPLLDARGYRVSDVTHVALTHLHADHAANLSLFPEAKIILGRRGWSDHLQRRATHPALVSDPEFPAAVLKILDEAERSGRLVLAEDGEEAIPGLRVWTVGGHTDDSTGYVVDTSTGRLVFPGDSVWTFDNLDQRVPVGSNVSLPGCLDALEWARSAGDVLIPSHDPTLPERYPDGIIAGDDAE